MGLLAAAAASCMRRVCRVAQAHRCAVKVCVRAVCLQQHGMQVRVSGEQLKFGGYDVHRSD